ncbi:MAG: glycosyl hydrolase, partial [Cyclobacteriaceae bacterium]|nr:glycosyl hydrolase [Cyclobacteriaceae bacterium]
MLPKFIFLVLLFVVFQPRLALTQSKSSADIFNNPPESAKPRGYWVWGHGNYDYTRIKEELKAFKEMGLGCVDIFDMGIADAYDIIPSGNPFMEDEMLDGISFALSEAKKLELRLGLSVSNGWNAGGKWTEPDEKIMQLLFWKDTIKGPKSISEIGFPVLPRTFKKPYGSFELFPEISSDGFPEYYKNVALVAFPLVNDGIIEDINKIQYYDVSLIDGNKVDIKLPPGDWVVARAVVSPLGQKMWMRSDNSIGYIMDHYSRKSTKHHFEHIIGKLEDRLGDLRETALEHLYLASFEAENYVIWSPELQETFYKQHGYQIDKYIPVFAGQKIVDKETTDRFLHDYRSTVSEMFVNNHYRQATEICNKHGVLLASESGGPGPPLHYVPTEDLKALSAVDIMRGEFWNKKAEYYDEHGNDILQVVKNIASAAHIYGHKIVEMESFTSHAKNWQESPLELKKLADRAFCGGMTRVVYHTMPHSPKEAGIPGWSYQAGTHISPKMTWWDLSKPFHQYFARTSALLQQGNFVADVAYYYGEQIPKFASGSKWIRKTLGEGYDYDDLNKEVLLKSTVTEGGQILLPSGMKYNLLVLPDDQEMSLEVMEKIEELLMSGATILGKKPNAVPGLMDYKSKELELKIIGDRIWGKANKKQKKKIGDGHIFYAYSEKEILLGKGINPDFEYSKSTNANLDYIHRSWDNEEIYFISNKDSLQAQVTAMFRVTGKQPYSFNPENGLISPIAMYQDSNGRTSMNLELEAFGSVFIVFNNTIVDLNHVTSIVKIESVKINKQLISSLRVSYNENGKIIFQPKKEGDYELTLNDASIRNTTIAKNQPLMEFNGPWDVRFPHGWGFNPIQQFDTLLDWRHHSNKEL